MSQLGQMAYRCVCAFLFGFCIPGFPRFLYLAFVCPKVLRYNPSEAYTQHLDNLDSVDGHDFDAAKQGTNRFATVVMYLNDVESGGETCFALSPEVPAGLPSDDEVLKSLRDGDMKVRGEFRRWGSVYIALLPCEEMLRRLTHPYRKVELNRVVGKKNW